MWVIHRSKNKTGYFRQSEHVTFRAFCSVCLMAGLYISLLANWSFGLDWNIPTIIRKIAMKLCTDICDLQRMNPTDFDDPHFSKLIVSKISEPLDDCDWHLQMFKSDEPAGFLTCENPSTPSYLLVAELQGFRPIGALAVMTGRRDCSSIMMVAPKQVSANAAKASVISELKSVSSLKEEHITALKTFQFLLFSPAMVIYVDRRMVHPITCQVVCESAALF